MRKLKVGNDLFSVCVDDLDGTCELVTHRVRTIRGGRITTIEFNKWTWVKLSTKNGHWGWSKRIDPFYRHTWTDGVTPEPYHRSAKKAWKAALARSKTERQFYIDEPEILKKAQATIKRMVSKSKAKK